FNSCAMIPGIVSEAQYEFDEGLALFNGGKYQEALPRFQRATELDPNFGRAYLYLGRSYVSLKNWRQAVAPLRTAYRLSPDETKKEALEFLIDALFAGGLDAYSSGDFESSVDYFKELFGLQPTSTKGRSEFVKALIAHGGNSLSKGNLPQAIAAYTEAVKLSPNSFDAIFGLAKAFFRNGEFSKALEAAQSAVRVEPANPDLQSFLQGLQKQ
ncbi:MAG: tetratricopeptide repeat protein, partial [Candidatus Binatia bacterium]